MILKAELVVLLWMWWQACVTADIAVYNSIIKKDVVMEFMDEQAKFGGPIPPLGVRAFLTYADPEDGCGELKLPNKTVPNFTRKWAVLIKRYGCNFEQKVRNAQAAQYDIAIVHNVNSSELYPMSANDPRGIGIVAVFVSERSGLILRDNYLYNYSYFIVVDNHSEFDINTQLLLPFAIVVGICFCTMLGFMIVKCIKDHRRARRHRLPSSSLRKIPTAKFRKGDPYETCAICLEDFVEEEKLRILPCSHAYHCKCVDPWLTRNRRVCPVCKRKVFAAGETPTNMTDSDSDSEVDDRTPLVRASGHTTQGGTFSSPLLNNVLRLPGALQRAGGARRHSAPDAEDSSAGPSNSTPSIQNPEDTQVVADINPVIISAAPQAPDPNEHI